MNVVGFYFYIKLQKETHFVESSNTSSKKYYLRLNNPFPALEKYSHTHNIYQLIQEIEGKENFEEKKENLRILSNIPYPLILIQVYQKLPENKRDRNSVKEELNFLKEKIHENYRDNFK